MSMLLYYFASAVKSIQFHVDDDIIDKLNYYYTTAIITGILFLNKMYQTFWWNIAYWFTKKHMKENRKGLKWK